MLTIERFTQASVARSKRWHPGGVQDWSLSDWGVALTGEVGEAMNIVKKLNRERDKIIGNTIDQAALLRALEDEIGDIGAYWVLFAVRAGINPERATIRKFNEVSERYGFPERL